MTTEEKIFEAARTVFQKKGFAGARMQEIADEAGINKAMLHYCFKNKKSLFEAVFKNAFFQIVPQINEIFNSEASVFDKIRKFTHDYITFISKNKFLPSFIIQEMNNNPDFISKILSDGKGPNPSVFLAQIEKEIKQGVIRPLEPRQLVLDIFSMSVFPFAAQMMLKATLHISDTEFDQIMEERKTHIAEQLINAIKK